MKNLFRASLCAVLMVFFLALIYLSIEKAEYSFYVGVFIAGCAAAFAAVVALIWYIPAYFVLEKHGKRAFGWYFLISVVPIVGAVIGLKYISNDAATALVQPAAIIGIIATIGAFVFWVIAVHIPRTTVKVFNVIA